MVRLKRRETVTSEGVAVTTKEAPRDATPPSAAALAAEQVVLAGVSNAVAATATNPIDVAKVRLQMQGEGTRAAGNLRGVSHALAAIASREGLSGLYRGLSASLVRELSYSGLRMGLYEPTKQQICARLGSGHEQSLAVKVIAGAITGCIGSALANPFDLAKVRAQASAGGGAGASLGAALREICREGGGVHSLWRGTAPTVQRATLLTASQVPTYDHVKHSLLERGVVGEGYVCHFISAMLAGVVAALVTSPVDLVKSRIMAQPIDAATGRGALYSSAIDCAAKVARAEGPLALYKGFNSQWLRIGPHTTISLMAFEQMRHLVGLAYL